MPRTIPLLLILVCATSFAQPVTTPTAVPVTSWLDGNPAPADGLPHGNGFQGSGGIWLPFSTSLWPSVLDYQPRATFGDFECAPGTYYLTGDHSSIIPITDPDGHVSWYILGYSPFHGEPPYAPVTGTIRDPLGAVVSFWNGTYDAQQFLIYVSNDHLIGCTDVGLCDPFTWGNNFGGVVAWPETNPQKLYWFFGTDRNDVDHGRGSHLIGVSNPPVSFQRSNCQGDGVWEAKFFTDPCPHQPTDPGPAPTSTFQTNRWLDTSSPNYTILDKVTWPNTKANGSTFGLGIIDKYNPNTDSVIANEFTPVLARSARRPYKKNEIQLPGHECNWNDPWELLTACQISRFAQITGTYRDGYFYLFLGLNTINTISVRIPYDASQPNGFHRRPGTNAIDAELWYTDAAHPEGAYQSIDTSQPISFSDDVPDNYCNTLPPGTVCRYPAYCPNLPAGTPCLANANPPVPEANAWLRDTGVRDQNGNRSGTGPMWPAAMVRYQTNVYWMTSGYHALPQPNLLHRLTYDSTNAQNPWSLVTPFQVHVDGNLNGTTCPGCTLPGNYTLPQIDTHHKYGNRGTLAIYPLSQRKAFGWLDVDPYNDPNDSTYWCLGWGGALMPLTVGDDTILNGLDFSISSGCSFTVSPTSMTNPFTASGGSQFFTVTTAAGCQWKAATSYAGPVTGWLSVSPASGSGSGSVTLTIAANSGGARTGYANIAGRQIVVTQNAAAQARGFYSMSPCRLLDTRNAIGPFGGPALQAGGIRNVQVAGQCGVAADASAVAVNVIAVTPVSASGYVAAYPGPPYSPPPSTSTISYTAGRTLANNAVIRLGPDGTINFYHAGSDPLQFVIDINGYFK
jgi:hypothetical protein